MRFNNGLVHGFIQNAVISIVFDLAKWERNQALEYEIEGHK